MEFDEQLDFPSNRKEVELIRWGILNPKEVIDGSACKIINAETVYEKTGIISPNGLLDERMGAIGENLCAHPGCEGNRLTCPGHFGHMKLTVPMYHILFIGTVKSILESVCHNLKCMRIPLDDKKYSDLYGGVRAYIKIAARVKTRNTCFHCGYKLPKITLNRFQIRKDETIFRADAAMQLFEAIKPRVLRQLGFSNKKDSNPKDFLLLVLPIPPPVMRPGCMYNGIPRLDALTKRLAEIVTHNFNIESAENGSKRDLAIANLQLHLNSYFDVRAARYFKIFNREWRSLKSLRCRLRGKQGRIRHNLMGKRVDFTARDVITGDPNIKIGEIGIPRSIAMRLTFPERVTDLNINRLQKMVCDGWKVKWRFLQTAEFENVEIERMLSLYNEEFKMYIKNLAHHVYDNMQSLDHLVLHPRFDSQILGLTSHVSPGNVVLGKWTDQQRIMYTYDFLKIVVRKENLRIYPSCNYWIPHGKTQPIDLRFSPYCPRISVGDVVERHLLSGKDYVAMNRQPSLHRQSFLAHLVIVLPGKTFRCNPSVTQGYNADYDGDEMNLHVPQSVQAMSELQHIASVQNNLLSSQSNKPIQGVVQDVLLAAYKMSKSSSLMSKSDVMNYAALVNRWDLPPCSTDQYWLPRDLFFYALPSTFCYSRNGVEIRNGSLLKGELNKAHLGATHGGIIQRLSIDFGERVCAEFIDRIGLIGNHYLLQNGFSVGVGDIILPHVIQEELLSKRGDETTKGNLVQSAQIDADVTRLVSQTITDLPHNNLREMVSAGSKGSKTNLAHIMGSVGQQTVDGDLIPTHFDARIISSLENVERDTEVQKETCPVCKKVKYLSRYQHENNIVHACGKKCLEVLSVDLPAGHQFKYIVPKSDDTSKTIVARTLPHFSTHQNGGTSSARGFVANNYHKGLNPTEFWFHAAGGRQGLIDTSTKTARTGYANRKLVKALENVVAHYDGSARDELDRIVQFQYGEDGRDATYFEKQSIDLYGMTGHEMSDLYPLELQTKLIDLQKELQYYLPTILRTRGQQNTWHLPINIDNLLQISKQCTKVLTKPIEPNKAWDIFTSYFNQETPILMKLFIASKLLKNTSLENLNESVFLLLVKEILFLWDRYRIEGGTSVGVHAAQAISEPMMQMTLNSFHFAGIECKATTTGVPRLEEIFNCAKRIRHPSMTLHPQPQYEFDALEPRLTSLTLNELVETFSPRGQWSQIDAVIQQQYSVLNIGKDQMFIKYTFKPMALREKRISKLDILERLDLEFGTHALIIPAAPLSFYFVMPDLFVETDVQQNNEMWVRVRFETIGRLFNALLRRFCVRGVPGILKCFRVQHRESYYIETDGVNWEGVLELEGIAHEKSTTNLPALNNDCLGLEVARDTIFKELADILMNADSTEINARHLSLVSDLMTRRGIILPMTRHGVGRENGRGALDRMSFESGDLIAPQAAVEKHVDPVKGVSSSVILNNSYQFGTSFNFDLLLDETKLKQDYLDKYLPGLQNIQVLDDYEDK